MNTNIVIDRQTFVFSVNLNALNPSQIQTPINLRFVAHELILKSLSYSTVNATPDTKNLVQIWCNLTNDGLLTSFPNNQVLCTFPDLHFTLNNNFQAGNIIFQFQKTMAYKAPIYYNPQSLISYVANPPDPLDPDNVTRGIVSFTIEFVKYLK